MKWESEDLSNHFKGCMENVFDKSKGRLRRSEITADLLSVSL